MQKIQGFDYLYRRGNRYLVRMQVPLALQLAVGRSELKKSLGADFGAARKDIHRVIADFQDQLERARSPAGPEPSVPALIDEHAIDIAVYAHFRRMTIQMRGKVAEPVGESPNAREARIAGFQAIVDLSLNALDRDDWEICSTDASWLSEEYGWSLDHTQPLFRYLCFRMLRARLECYRQEIRTLKGDFSERADGDTSFGPSPPKPAKAPRNLGQLMDKFTKEREGSWSQSTVKNYVIITRVLEEICGRETALGDIDKEFCRRVRDTLCQLPANYQKKPQTRGRPIDEVIEIAKAQRMPLIMPATINSHLNKFGALVRFGRDEGWVQGNPMAGIEVDDPVDAEDKRDPFSISHLQSIFSSEPWASRDMLLNSKPSRYWVPLIGLFTGARRGEICGLRVDEIVQHDGTWIIELRNRPDRKIKARKSRVIPVHSMLKHMGLIDFVEHQKKAKQEFLFPEEKADTLGLWGDALSDWFGRLITRLEIKGANMSFHSLRHSFEDALREADLHDTPIGNALTGRQGGGISKNYGTKFSTAKLVAAIESITYVGLTLSHLHAE